ncbi:MAG: MBL fold metallo-hydrolase [Candidatus Diapherotrites archaeon]|nr:MBL fold metallo-hydrolase [Candidatus Diapherotrites archaeon]
MAELKVLVEGYAREIDGGWIANPTVTLVKSNGKNIVVDPGCNREKLLAALKGEGLTTADIDYVILTHNHSDHILLAGIFENAKVITTDEIYDGDHQVYHHNKMPETELELIPTPGHCEDHVSVKVPTAKGTYIVVGDVFWFIDGEEQTLEVEREDPAPEPGVDMKALIESRRKVLGLADFIVPGHGKIVKVK